MTIEEIKATLKKYRFVAGEISDLLDERIRLRSLAEKVTPSLSFAPVHGALLLYEFRDPALYFFY